MEEIKVWIINIRSSDCPYHFYPTHTNKTFCKLIDPEKKDEECLCCEKNCLVN